MLVLKPISVLSTKIHPPPLCSLSFPNIGIGFHSTAAIKTFNAQDLYSSTTAGHGRHQSKKFNSRDLGICISMIPRPTRKVLTILRQRGYDAYLVGGCVRDLILKRLPKDFDVITSAELGEVVRAFAWCQIVGRRFPICHVHVDDTIVEVSSFKTKMQSLGFNNESGSSPVLEDKNDVRYHNCLLRDFTINGLMFDPFAKLVYDYLDGLNDIMMAKVQTVVPASNSFRDDPARILRAIRIAARLGFHFSRETAYYVKHYACCILMLDKGRLMMEMNNMLAHGSGEASVRLLWKFGLLEILLPFQAAYFIRHQFRRRDKRSNLLLSLISNMDVLFAPDRPCHNSLWISILAFHKAISDHPRDVLVIAAFCLSVCNGGDVMEAISIARGITRSHETTFYELLCPQLSDPGAILDEVLDLAASIRHVLSQMTNEHYVSQAMAAYPEAPCSNLVLISLSSLATVCRIFECVDDNARKANVSKHDGKINYKLMVSGNLTEVRHVFARIIFQVLFPFNQSQMGHMN